MYIHLTTRCNMTCEHCCVSALKTGIDFKLNDFRKVIDEVVLPHEPYHIALGGGEPTLHRHFLEMLMICIADFESVFVATNGTNKKAALLMARLARKGVMTAALSMDDFHDTSMIDPEVIQAFTRTDHSGIPLGQRWADSSEDYREIRNVSEKLVRTGRARELEGVYELTDWCVCETPQIYPDGRIHHCGYDDAPVIGNWKESTDIEIPCGTCYRNPEDV